MSLQTHESDQILRSLNVPFDPNFTRCLIVEPVRGRTS